MDATSYEEWLLAKGLGWNTVYNYRGKLLKADRIAKEQGWDLRHPSVANLRTLADHFPYSASTRGMLRTALSHYWEMCGTSGPVLAIPCPHPPPPRYRGLSEEEADLMEVEARGSWPEGGAVMLGLYLALRREEMATLTWESFTPSLGHVTIVGKFQRTRHIPVHESLRHLLASRRDRGWVFPGQREHAHTGTLRNWIGNVGLRAGVGYVNPHALRYTCLAEMLDETGDLRTVQYFAGHADPQQTSHYTRATEKRLQAAVGALYRRRAA